MFAVPGWSVSAANLKTQTEPLPSNNPASANGSAAKSKKRKRGGKEKNPAVTSENVADLWQQQFEGVKPSQEKPHQEKGLSKKERKRQKLEGTLRAENGEDVAIVNGGSAADAVPEGKEMEQYQEAKSVPAEDESTKEKKRKKNKDTQKDKPKGKAPTNIAARTDASNVAASAPPAPPSLPAATKLTPMQSAMRQKLISARFRHLNQTLYTAPSATSLALFAENPEMFDDYHSGFRQQVSVWPENPVDNFIFTLQERGSAKPPGHKDKRAKRNPNMIDASAAKDGVQPLPRTHGTCTVADLGCGDARLASTLTTDGSSQKRNLKILSYDLQSNSPLVTKADVANLPLEDGSVDVAIFCLALMGTNWIDFIEEAYRILHWKGELWVAEIKSRIGRVGGDKGKSRVVEHSVGSRRKAAAKQKAQDAETKRRNEEEDEKALKTEVDGVETVKEETDVSGFVEVLKRRGFVLKSEDAVDLSNRMFVKMEFIKAAAPMVGKNVKAVEKEGGDAKGETWKKKPKGKFLEEEKEVSVEDETKVLKPCLYKIR